MASPSMPLPPGATLVPQNAPLPPGASLVSGVPKERSFGDAVANAGEKFWEWTGKPVALALGLSGGSDAERGDRARAAQAQIVSGIMQEPARVRYELTNALDAFVNGNPRATMHHVLNAVPIVGEGINQAAQEFNRGDTSSGVGHMAAILTPAAVKEAPAIARGARAMGTAAKEVVATMLPERTPPVEGVTTNPIVHRVARYMAGKVMPGGGLAYDVLRDVAGRTAEAAPAAAELTPGQLLARESGADWASLSPNDQAMLESVARANANAAAQPQTRPPMGPPQAPAAEVAPEATAQPALTLSEMIDRDIAAQKAASGEPAPPPPEAAPPAAVKSKRQPPVQMPATPGTAQRVATPMGTTGTPLGTLPLAKPLAQMTRAEIIEATGLPADANPQQIAQAVANPPAAIPVEAPPVAPQVETAPPAPVEASAPPAKPARTEATAEMVGSRPVASSQRFMGDESIKTIEPDKYFVKYTNPTAAPGAGMKFNLAETEGTNGAKRFNAYRGAIKSDSIVTSPPDASALVRNGKIESVYVNPDWRGSGLFGQFMRDLADKGYTVAEDSPKSASYLAAESKMQPAAAPPAAKRPTLKQVEAGMKQMKQQPDIEAPQSNYTETGERKSPELRAAELTQANRAAKAQRFAQALHDSGITSEMAAQIENGRLSDTQITQGMAPRWGNIADYFKEKGPPSDQTLPQILAEMKRLERSKLAVSKNQKAAEIAAQLAAEMEK